MKIQHPLSKYFDLVENPHTQHFHQNIKAFLLVSSLRAGPSQKINKIQVPSCYTWTSETYNLLHFIIIARVGTCAISMQVLSFLGLKSRCFIGLCNVQVQLSGCKAGHAAEVFERRPTSRGFIYPWSKTPHQMLKTQCQSFYTLQFCTNCNWHLST